MCAGQQIQVPTATHRMDGVVKGSAFGVLGARLKLAEHRPALSQPPTPYELVPAREHNSRSSKEYRKQLSAILILYDVADPLAEGRG
jgi:hypothetical protein